MIEIIIKDYLKSVLGIPAFLEIPEKNIPLEFLIVEKTGSGRKNLIENATLAIQSYSDSMLKAGKLNERVKETMDNAMYDCDDLLSTELNSDYPFNDTANKRYRYQAVYDVYF